MTFNCKDCNYSTGDSGNWSRHNKSNAHIKKVQEKEHLNIKNGPKPLTGQLAGQLTGQLTTQNDERIKSKYVCPYCKQSLGSASSLSRHKNHRCSKNVANDESSDDLHIKSTSKASKTIKELEKDNESLKKELEYFKSLATNAIDTAKSSSKASETNANISLSALGYISQMYANAPLLKPLDDYSMIKDNCKDDDKFK